MKRSLKHIPTISEDAFGRADGTSDSFDDCSGSPIPNGGLADSSPGITPLFFRT
jgi:hypothetical protein